jgi:parallel beta-helix repeat protein
MMKTLHTSGRNRDFLPPRLLQNIALQTFKKSSFAVRLSLFLLLPFVLVGLSFQTANAQVTYTFTNATATGPTGPTQAQVNTAYTSTALAGKVTVVNGIQYWVVPSTALYRLEASGAKGYGPYGGRGAFMSGDFQLKKGDTLKILVGQKAPPPIGSSNQYAGGGGTFVTYANNTPLLVAGGGAGSWATSYTSATDATTATAGNSSVNSANVGAGGTSGNGGATAGSADGGGGLLTNGGGTNGGKAFVNGGLGGNASTSTGRGEGGFGCGGGTSSWDNYRCGGGGGYSGGAGGSSSASSGNPEGGGGGSYNAGTKQVNSTGVGMGDGILVIKVLSSGAYNDAGITAVDSPTVYCLGLNKVVASVQNFGKNKLDSVTINWSANGVLQTPIKYIGTLDTIGGSGSVTAKITLGNYTFPSTAVTIKVWSSLPNGVADTVKTNDTAVSVKTPNLPAPGGVTNTTLTPNSTTITWSPGALSSKWAYVNKNTSAAPTNGDARTIVSSPSATLSGLNPRTTYYFYVREICATTNDSSGWSGPFIYKTPCTAPLSGVYTINPSQAPSSTNFLTFTEAVAALTECTISGPVVFNVSAATFTERLNFGVIPGASATNTVKFIGSGKGNTILTNAGTSTANMATVTYDGTDYVTFRDMTVRGTGTTYGTAFMLNNQADYNTFSNLYLQMSTSTTSSTVAGIALSGSATSNTGSGNTGNYNTFDSLQVEGGYYGIVLYGSGTTLQITNNTITNSTFTGQYYYNIYTYYNNKLFIDNNTTSPPRVSTGYGLYMVYASNSRISNNTITSNYYGIYSSNFNTALYDNTVRSMIYNNSVTSSGYYAYYATSCSNYGFYHNSLNSSSASTARLTTGSKVSFVNNQVKNYRTTAASYAMYITSVNFDTLDYNNYISYSSSDQFYHDGAYADFTSYKKGFTTYHLNSYNDEPNYTSNTDLHIDQSKINFRGTRVGIATDNDGDARCTFAPTMGADESIFPTPAPKSAIALPDTVYDQSPAVFISSFSPLAGVALDYTWYIDGAYVGSGRDYPAVLPAGTYTVSLKVRSCQASDSSAKTVQVIPPGTSPVADFTASKLVLDVAEPTQFSDLSRFGATKWTWSASPASDVIWTDKATSTPSAFFLEPGQYEVCLTTENAIGQSAKKCKTAFISVNDDITFCSSKSSTYSTGRITDEGGATGIYSSSTSCSFLIEPCADKVYLKFSEFDLADAGDVLKIYDGIDNTGILLGSFTYGALLPGGSTGLIANSGRMYLDWNTNGAGASKGFIANWSSTPDVTTAPPVADFIVTDTVFTGRISRFESKSTGALLRYAWDFNPPNEQAGFEGGDHEFDRYRWNAAGIYDVTLNVTNCGGINSITKQITVIDPTSKPVIGFYANKRRAPVLNVITFYDTSKQGPSVWKWQVSPAATSSIIGPDNEEQLKVSFSKSGFYTVKLIASNTNGDDSLVKVNYIDIFDYCDPVSNIVTSDIGISRVKLGTLTNPSPIGQSRFTSYLNDFSPVKMYRRGSLNITLDRNTTIDSMSRKVWVDWNNDGDFNDSLEQVLYEPAAKTLSYSSTFTAPAFANLGFTTLRIGTSFGNDKNTPCGINPAGEYEDYPLEIAEDDQLPVITVLGSDTVYVEQWHQYTDAGATANDNIDGDLTNVLQLTNNVDSTIDGTYYITYKVTDVVGNEGLPRTRVVIVTPDVTAPVITLNGNAIETVTVNTPYTDAGATALDYYNRSLSSSIATGDNLNLSVVGSYYLYYTVADAAGNTDSVARIINVIDDIAPVVNLVGGDTITMEVNTPLVDPGYTAIDNYDPTVNVSTNSSQLNTAKVGIYPIVYTGKDSSGNSTVVTRYVRVQDNTAPVIKLIGKDTVTLDVNTDYFEQGAKVSDNYCKGLQWTVDIAPDTKVIGEYVLTYNAVDCENNNATVVTRVVKVVDRTAPILYLNGLPSITVMRWLPYTDAGVKITDNYYDTTTLKGLLTVQSNIDLVTEGVYSICYEVVDPSGNASNQVCRVVTVTANTTSVNELGNGSSINVYPNPSTGNFTFDFGKALEGPAAITIVDMVGKEVYTQEVSALTEQLSVDLVGLPSGVYMARIQEGQNNTVLRIAITR